MAAATLAGAPQPLGDHGEHRERDPGLVVEQLHEVARADREAADVGLRPHARRP